MEEENMSEVKVNLIPCINWVKRGAGAANPEKIELTPEELERIIRNTQEELDEIDFGSDNEGSSSKVKPKDKNEKKVKVEKGNKVKENSKEKVKKEIKNEKEDAMEDDEYSFAKYDEESDMQINMAGLVELNDGGKDPFITVAESDDEDSEKEDDIIKPDDNLVLIGHVEGDASILEVFIYNEAEGSFYCHHDILLPSFPLCIEWLNFDPSVANPGNLCAIGNMTPIIDVWDLDIIDCLEPAFQLGSKPSKKKKLKRIGHRDAVLDIAWNTNFTHILGSGSVDQTVLLWDMENGKPVTKFSSFEEKVQALKWHPHESHLLLTGCADKLVRIFDGRSEDEFKSWKCEGEIERVLWNHFDPNFCFISTENGYIECIDIRQSEIVWKKHAHEKEVTGLSLSSSCPGLLVSSSNDGMVKVWDVLNNAEPQLVLEKNGNIGNTQCLAANPDIPFVFVAGGDQKSNNLRLLDFSNNSEVTEKFGQRELIKIPDVEKTEPKTEEMMDVTEELESMGLESQVTKIGKKKKKLK